MTRKSVYVLFLGVAVVAGGCQKKDAAPSPATSPAATMSEDEKAVYALGAAIGQQVGQQTKALDLSPAEIETLKKAIAASLAGQKPEFEIAQYGPKLQARAEAHATTAAAAREDQVRRPSATPRRPRRGRSRRPPASSTRRSRPARGRAPRRPTSCR